MSTDQDMFDRLIGPIREKMMWTVARIVGNPDDSADTLQNALVSVWDNLDTIRAHPNPQAYILRLCISAAYNTVRKRARDRTRNVPMDCVAPLASASPSPPASLIASERQQTVLDAIASLPPQQAEALVLRIVEGEPFDAIARVLGCDEQTVRSHVSKGKAKLRDILLQTGIL